MSLIERAVNRLSSAKNLAGDKVDRPKKDVDAKASTLEKTIARLEAETKDLLPTPVPVTNDQQKQSVSGRSPIRIHLEAIKVRGFVTPDGEQSQIGQEFRLIKRPLLINAFGRGAPATRNGKRVMVSSAFPGEGKSFCAINLAISIAAEKDFKVILIDADVARPSIPRELGFECQGGLMDLLIDPNKNVVDYVMPTNVKNLSILSAGKRHKQATEFLASASMTKLLDDLSTTYSDSILVFDSPPLLVTTESQVLASYMGQIVLVVEAGRTPRETVNEALASIESNDIIGLVLNKSQNISAGSNYQYGGYGYGYGSKY
jgi:protein-tyrosine kinase